MNPERDLLVAGGFLLVTIGMSLGFALAAYLYI